MANPDLRALERVEQAFLAPDSETQVSARPKDSTIFLPDLPGRVERPTTPSRGCKGQGQASEQPDSVEAQGKGQALWVLADREAEESDVAELASRE